MLTISFTITVPTAADLPLWRGKGEGVLGEDVVRESYSAVVEGPLLAALLLTESAVAEVDADVGDQN